MASMVSINDSILIQLIQSYPHLYNNKRSDFKDQHKKDNSWMAIGQILRCKTLDAQNRWRYLREKYCREKKVSNLPSGSGAPSKSDWDLYSSMVWLDPFIRKRRVKTNFQIKIEDPETITDENQTEELGFWSQNDSSEQFETNQGFFEDSALEIVYETPEHVDTKHIINDNHLDNTGDNSILGNESTITPTPSNRQNNDNSNAVIVESLQMVGDGMKSAIQLLKNKQCPLARAELTENDHIGKLVTCKLNKLNRKKKKILKRKLFEMLTDCQSSDSD